MSSVLEAANNIKILIEREESEEVLALYGGGRCVLSQNYKNWYDPLLSYWIIPIFVILGKHISTSTIQSTYLPPPLLVPGKEGATHEQFPVCSTSTWANVCRACKCWTETWSSTENANTKWATTCYFWLHYRSTNNISDFNGNYSKYLPLPSFSVPASPETTTITLSSPVTSALVSFQASSNQCIYLLKILNRCAKPPSNFLWGVTCISSNTQKYGPEKTPYLHTFHAVRMAIAPCSIPRPTKNYLGMDPLTFISRITSLKHMTVKVILHLMNSLFTNKLNCMREPERNDLMLTLSIQKIWE